MFGNKNKRLEEKVDTLTEVVATQNHQLSLLSGTIIELKKLIVGIKTETLANRVAIKQDKQPVKIIEKEVTVTRARKKPRARLRTTGGKKITEEEKAEFVKLYDQGLSFVEISGQTGRSTSAISNYVFEKRGED